MKVSIITVCYNSADSITKTIESVLSQTYADIEYIVVDGASTDATMKVLERYQDDIAHLVSEKDQGVYDAINKGLRRATGDLVGLLHADDFMANNDVIALLVKKITEEQADSIYADLQYVDEDKIVREWKSGAFTKQKYRQGWMPPHPTFYIKRVALEREEMLYRLDFGTAADYEFMLRKLIKNNLSVCYLEKVIVKMQVGGLSNESLRSRIKANAMDAKAWEVNGLRPFPFFRLLKPMRKLIQWV